MIWKKITRTLRTGYLPICIPSRSTACPTLRRVIRSLIPRPSLRVFKCHYMNFGDFMPALAKEFGRLLWSAGERLEDFGFTIQAEAELDDGVDLDARFKLTDVARIPNLRRIKFSIEDTGRYLIPFLRRLAESGSSTPMLETLDIYYLSEYDLDWEKLDDILQHPCFHALREIKTTVETYFNFLDVVGQEKPKRPGWYSKPNDGSRAHTQMRLNITEFVERLPNARRGGYYDRRRHIGICGTSGHRVWVALPSPMLLFIR